MKLLAEKSVERQVLSSRGSTEEHAGSEKGPLRWHPVGAPYLALQGIDVRDFALEAYHAEAWKTGEF